MAPAFVEPVTLVWNNLTIAAQKISVNGNNKGSLEGMRAPSTNNPVQDVNSASLICGAAGSTSQTVVSANAGDKIGAWFQHVIGGPQGANDPDNPIAASHHGPVIAYMAKVDNAASSSHQGLQWFKIGQDTFDTSSKKWGVGKWSSPWPALVA